MDERDPDIFHVPSGHARVETVVKGSRFIGDVSYAGRPGDADATLVRVQKEFHAATHHCWAYRVGAEQVATRFSDDGEPAGTAGRPILDAIAHSGLSNVLVVVTRYFGGTKLGTGGLARAYADAAKGVLAIAAREERVITSTYEIEVPYEFLPAVRSVLYRLGARLEERFGEVPRLVVTIRRSQVEQSKNATRETGRGKVRFTETGS